MSSTPMLLEFAAETCLFVASVEGIVLALRADLLGVDRETQVRLGLGFGLLGIGARCWPGRC